MLNKTENTTMKKKTKNNTDNTIAAITSGKTALEISKALDAELKRRASAKYRKHKQNFQKVKHLLAELLTAVTEFVGE